MRAGCVAVTAAAGDRGLWGRQWSERQEQTHPSPKPTSLSPPPTKVVAPRTILRLLESTMPTTWERSKPHGWTAVHVAKTIHVDGQGHSIQADVVPAIPCNKRGDVFLVPHGRLWKKYSMRADLERLPRRKGPLTALVRLLKAMSGILGLGVDGVVFEHLALAVVDDVDAFTWPGMPLAVRSAFVLLRTELASGSTSAGGRKKVSVGAHKQTKQSPDHSTPPSLRPRCCMPSTAPG